MDNKLIKFKENNIEEREFFLQNQELIKNFIDLIQKVIFKVNEIRTEFADLLKKYPQLTTTNKLLSSAINWENKNEIFKPFKELVNKLLEELRGFLDSELFHSNPNILRHIQINSSDFSHNLNINSCCYIGFTLDNLSDNIIRKPVSQDKDMRFSNFFKYSDSIIFQIISHFQSIINILQRKIGIEEDVIKEYNTNPFAVAQQVVQARTSISNILVAPSGTFLIQDEYPIAYIPSFINHVELKHVSPEEVMEMLYPAVSNGTNVLERVKDKNNSAKDLLLDVTVNPVEYMNKKYYIFEVFNTGLLIDINQINKQLLKFKYSQNFPSHIQKIITAIKNGSRQSRISDPIEILFAYGFTMKNLETSHSGTGIGLADMERLVMEKGGTVILNNVYNENPKKEGVCTTIILPTDIKPEELDTIKNLINDLKEALKNGEFILSENTIKLSIEKLQGRRMPFNNNPLEELKVA